MAVSLSKSANSQNSNLKRLWFAYLSGLILWIMCTYADTIKNYLENKAFAYVQDGATYTADFILYYNDGILSWECLKKKIDVYDARLQNEYLQKLVPHVKLDKIFYSQYPPYLFVLMMPLPLLPMPVVWILWELCGLFFVFFIVRSILKTTLKGKFTRVFTYVAVLASFPTWLCFRLAQVALVLFPALMGYWIALDRKMWFRAGLLGGFCLLKLQYAPILFLTGFFLGGFRFAAGYALMGFVYLLMTVGVLGWENLLSYPQALKFGEISGQVTGVAPEAQQNIRGQLVVILRNDGSLVHLISVIAWAVATLGTAYLWWRYSRQLKKSALAAAAANETAGADSAQNAAEENRKKFMILASVTMILQLVTSPHTHRQDYIFMVLPAIWLMYGVVGDFPLGAPALKSVRNKVLLLILRYMIIGFPILSWFFYLIDFFYGIYFNGPLFIQPFLAWALILLLLLGIVSRQAFSKRKEAS